MQKRNYWTARTAFFLFVFFFWLHCFWSHAERNWQGDVWWLMGKGSQTKLRTEKKKKSESYWNDFNSMSLANWMPWNNSISLTWQMFGCISWGEGIWQQLLSSETWEPETEVIILFFFHFPSSLLIPIPSEPSVLASGMMSSCFFVAKGPHTPQWRINTIHVFFS